MSPEDALLSASLVGLLAGSAMPSQYAQAAAPAAQQPIGRVETVSGSATVTRNGFAVDLNVGDLVFQGDVVQTRSDSTLGIDGSAFSLKENTRMALNEFVYVPNRTTLGIRGTFVNHFLTPLTNAIIERNGTIDKYIGDAITAFWNAPLDDPQQEVNACEAALEMLARADKLNRQFKHEADQNGGTYRPLHVGIGLNTGPCVVGNMGSDFRFNYSVLGDTVNVASRLEGRTKDYRIPIVIGAGTEQSAREKFATLEIDRIQVKGKTQPETVFTLLGRAELAQNPNFREMRDLTAKMLGTTASRIGRRRWRPSSFAARLPNRSASARSSICTPNASRPSGAIRRRRIGTASTRPRVNSVSQPPALARASREQKR